MGASFLDQQARIGIPVHLGGLPATRRLLSLCHVAGGGEASFGYGLFVGRK